MPDPSSTETNRQQRNEQDSDASKQMTSTDSAKPILWGRADRNRLFLWAGIAFLPSVAFTFGLHLLAGRNPSVLTVQSELPLKAVMVFFVALATWVVARREKRPLDDYGIPPRQAFGARFWEGSVWGFAMLSAILLILKLSGHFRIDALALHGTAILRWGLAWSVTFLAVSLSEELAFRGYWLFTMSRRMRFWPAAFFLSAIFAVAHLSNSGENVLGILQVIATGLLFCLMIRRTGTLWFAIGFHAAWDWAETFFYGTPDSGLLGVGPLLNSSTQGPQWLTGGSAGPEGSIFAFVVLIGCALLIHLRFSKAIYPDRPI